jgi:membrane-bound lytic murein transglycosylase MltF
MTTRALTNSSSSQIAFRYRATDSATGVSRETAKRLAAQLGVDETQAIHIALHDMAMRLLAQYETDDGALTAAQLEQIKQQAPQGTKRAVRSSLFELKTA